MARYTDVDYASVLDIYSDTPEESQVASSAPTPITYSREAAVAKPIVALENPPETHTDVITLFQTIMEHSSSRMTKKDLLIIMSLGFCLTPPGCEGPAMWPVAQGANVQPLSMPGITAVYDSRAAASSSTMNIDPDEGEQSESTQAPAEEEDIASQCRAISYICLSLMRLAVKRVETFMKGTPQLITAYHVLMGDHSPFLSSFNYSRGLCSNISSLFNQCDDMKRTLAHHCAVADESHHSNRTVHGPLRFLILQHMDLNGMVPYGMYVDMKRGLPLLSPGSILTWLHDAQVAPILLLLSKINKEHDRVDKPDRFWRYSRSIDPGFFVELQQSRCYILIARMADILVRGGCVNVTEYSDPKKAESIKDKANIMANAERFGTEFMLSYNALSGAAEGAGPVARALANAAAGNPMRRILVQRNPRPQPAVNVTVNQPPRVGALDSMIPE
ncbi:nucleocapsid [Clerodendrum chlorotic spot virus]|uniref:Nucleoprotein n=1 Tax=Clerodendrum chlorotic spot virus TaxID=1064520 RepID=A0A2U9Q3C9_9RHAB|nr:nucleocapsid [Clerodendrum chlorotic spot virus]AWT62660.1 nucleocapsid [Clerodendrum chlorotic spot virus]AWT62672.1 nucleocapsid [Clerodendrum chlorotic spot virus]